MAVVLALSLLASGSLPTRADEVVERDYKLWYERATLGQASAGDALAADKPVRLYKWFNPLKVAAWFDPDTTHHGPELRSYLRAYLKKITEVTNITAGLTPEEGGVTPNVLILVGESAADSASRHRAEISDLWGDNGEKAEKLAADPQNKENNCLFTIHPREKGSDDIAGALIFSPIAEDIFATQKCIGAMLYRIMGMLGTTESESVLNRADTVILPTKDDVRALRIQYIDQIQNGDSPSAILSVIGRAQSQGVLP